MSERPPFTCPKCGWTSQNPNDRAEGYCGNCKAYTLVDFLLEVGQAQERIVLLVEGVVWEGHVEEALAGTVVAAVRPVGLGRPFERKRWTLAEIDQIARAEDTVEADEEDVDPLVQYARHLAEKARAYSGLTLAERLVREHTDKGRDDDDGRS